MDVDSVRATCKEMESEESNGDMEDLPGNLVSVNEAAPLPVDWDKAEGTRRAGDVPPVRRARRGGGGG